MIDKIRKDTYIHIRISSDEKKELEDAAKKGGFNSVSAFILLLFRKFGKSLA
jgi:uncharacterized protein (DUF1778 family)